VDEVRGEVPVRLLQPPVARHAGFPCRGPGEGSAQVHLLFFQGRLGQCSGSVGALSFLGLPDPDPELFVRIRSSSIS
jgi:hypothetical protein